MKKTIVAFVALVLGSGACFGLGANNNIQLNNSLRFSWNDNYYQTTTNETSTGAIIEQPEILANYNRETTYLGLRYRPSFTWYTNPDIERQETLQHELDANWNQTLSPRFSFTLAEIFRMADQPELLDRNNQLVYPDQSYVENSISGSLGIQLRQTTRLDISGGYYLLDYDNAAVATNNNYDILSAGLTLRQEVSKSTAVFGLLNYGAVSYRDTSANTVRNAATTSVAVGLDRIFGQRLIGSVMGGMQAKSFELSSIDGQNSPYGNVSLTYLLNPRLRLTAGGGYSLWESQIQPYANQERLSAFGSVGYDISSRISFYVSGGVTRGKYHADQAANQDGISVAGVETGTIVIDGVDTIYQASARLSYQINRHNWIDAGYGYTTLASDLRPEFDRNVIDLGWRISF
jgi:opacity protein-like surface antigen